MRTLFAVVLVCMWVDARPAYAQLPVLDHFNPISAKLGGIHLHGATLSSTYFSNSFGAGPFGATGGGPGFGLAGSRGSLSDSPATMIQGSAVFGWSKVEGAWSGNITYSPSYVRAASGTNYRSLNHTLSAAFDRALTRKWKLSTSVNGIATDFSQLLFARTPYADLSSTPATAEEFFSTMLTGTSANPTLTQVAGTAAVIGSPETAYLYGDRLFSTAATLSVSYAYSTRSTLNLSVGAGRTQPFQQGATAAAGTQNNFIIPRTSSGTASVGWSYSLTPRTTLTVNLGTTRTLSTLQDAYTTQGTVSLGRMVSRRWFVYGTAGIGAVKPLRTTFTPSDGAQHIYGGGVGYKVAAHTFVFSYTRALSDVYGLGASASESGNGAWTWKHPGRSVSTSATFGYSRLNGAAFSNSTSWMGQGSAAKALGRHLALSIGCSYTQFPRTLLGAGTPNRAQTGVMSTLSWSPSRRE